MKEKFDLIFGVGENCNTSLALRQNNLQIASFPFDWLGFSDLEKNISIILDDFKNFINEEDLEILPNSFNGRTDTYVNKKNNLHFVHDFVPDIDFKKQFIFVKNKYQKRQKRLYELISKSNKVLIVYISSHETELSKIIEKYKYIQEKISKKFPNIGFSYLYIQSSENQEYEYNDKRINLRVITINKIIEKKEFKILGIKFSMKIFLYSKILKKYKLKMNIKSKIKNFIYLTKKVFINIIPNKKIQSKLRHKNCYE